MKRNYLFMTLVFLVLTLTSCSSIDDLSLKNEGNRTNFENALNIHRQEMSDLLGKHTTRGSEAPISDDELAQIAEQLDSAMGAFYDDNREDIDAYAPELNLTEEQLEILLLDQDSLISFVNANMTDNICYAVIQFFEAEGNYPLEELISNHNLNPFEAVVISNLATCSEYEELVRGSLDAPDEPIDNEEPSKESECFEEWMENKQSCLDQFRIDLVADMISLGGSLGGLGSIGGLPGVGLGSVVGIGFGIYVANEKYKNCKDNADKAHNRCLKK